MLTIVSFMDKYIRMDFIKEPMTSEIGEAARRFAIREILPNFMQWDETQEFPVEVFRKMGQLGFMGVLVPEEYGGSGLGYFEYVEIIKEISKVCGSIGLSLAAHNSLCTGHILSFGNE